MMRSSEICSNTDFLTKLYNRSHGVDVIHNLIKDGIEFSMFYIDLNKFKVVNDLYGHDVGDLVLQEVGKRFKTLENEDLLFARFGGDEIIGVYQNIDVESVNTLGQRINKVLEDHIIVSESEFSISASMGVARYPIDADNIDDLLKLSDMAMYKAKKSTTDYKYLITDELNTKLVSRRKIEKFLKQLDVEKDLFIEYQPIFDVKTGDLNAIEALVRWNHKTEGIIYPNDFISIAEEIDVVKDITKWVFIHSLKQIGEWNRKYGTDYKISLNVSDACIHNKIFFGNVQSMLDTFGVKANWLTLELTEASISVSPEYMKPLLHKINESGIDIQLDKFGTYPILISELKEFFIKDIKIDKKFIARLENDEDVCVIKSMILLAKGLRIKTIAVGVETIAQYEQLKQLGCDKVQGFYFDKPMGKEAFEEKYLKARLP